MENITRGKTVQVENGEEKGIKKLWNAHKKLAVAKLTKPNNLNEEILLWRATFCRKL